MIDRTTKPHKIPWIANGILYLSESNGNTIKVDSPEWFAWLDIAVSFAYADTDGSFTARLETTRSGGKYWKAYRRQSGKLRSFYLGKNQYLDLELLHTAAKQLSVVSSITTHAGPDPPVDNINQRKDLHPLTKFFIPSLPPNVYHRPRLFEPFRDLSKSVIWVTSPPYYGKTTLVVDWISIDRPSVAWVSLDERDNEDVLFWSSIAMSLDSIQKGLASRSLSLLQSVPPDQEFIPSLINDLEDGWIKLTTPQPVVLILDDFQNIENPKIHSALSAFINRMPTQLRLVIVSRSYSPFQLGHLRLYNKFAEIGMNDLVFQRSEVEGFIKENSNLELPDRVVEQLMQLTEGWIGAIQLALKTHQSSHSYQVEIPSFTGIDSNLFSPLFDEAISHQTEPVKQFLLITSILDRLCAELCDRLIAEGQRRQQDNFGPVDRRDSSSGQTILNYLVNHNMFLVPLDLDKVWFRYHPLFARIMRERLQAESPKLKIRLHEISTRWLAEQDLLPEAISHALASRDQKFAAELIEKGGRIALHQGKYRIVRTWLQALGQDAIRTNPYLCLLSAIVYILNGELHQAKADLDHLDLALQTSDEDLLPGQDLDIIRNITRAYLLATISDDISTGLKRFWRVYRKIPEHQYLYRGMAKGFLIDIHNRCDRPSSAEIDARSMAALSKKAGNYRMYFRGIAEAANAHLKMGKLHAAQLTLEKASRSAHFLGADEIYDDVTSMVASSLAYERNDLEKAWRENSREIVLGKETGTAIQAGQALFMLCKLHLTRGDYHQAHQALDQVDALFSSLSHPLSASLAAWRAHVWLKQVMLEDNPDYAMESAVKWAEAVSKKVQSGEKYVLHETIWPTHITLARVHLAVGKISEALTLTEKLRSQLETARARGALIEVLTLLSLIQEASGQHTEALKTLHLGLTWGESEGFVRSIIDAGTPINILLDDARAELKLPFHMNRYISKLQEVIPNTGLPQNNYPENLSPIHLTTTEKKILQKLSEGYSTAEIARELTVSDNTVKTHISHILNKFQVTRRAQAVHKARELAIVD